MSRRSYSNRWDFFHCEELNLVFFYRDEFPLTHDPEPALRVYCEALGRNVELIFIGRGKAGHQAYKELEPTLRYPRFFPVDLYHVPFRIHPRPSRKVAEEDWQAYRAIIREVRQFGRSNNAMQRHS